MKHDSMDEMQAMLELMMAIDELESFMERQDFKNADCYTCGEVIFDKTAWKDGLVENWEDENES